MNPCQYRGRLIGERCYCRHPERPDVVWQSECNGCRFSDPIPASGLLPVCPSRLAPIGQIVSGCPHTNGRPIFGCEHHGQCVLSRLDREDAPGVKCCETCDGATVSADDLAIVTCHFNPLRYALPVRNYWEWRHSLGPLARNLFTIELSFDGHFGIPDSIRRSGGPQHLLWQKEALINEAVRQLPERFKYVAWVDHDLVFSDHSWAERAVQLLGTDCDVIQLFELIDYTHADGSHERTRTGAVRVHHESEGLDGSPGGAWAARRDFFQSIGGLVSQNIVGSGDQVACDAFLGRETDYWRRNCERMKALDREWSANVRRHLTRGVGYLPEKIKHLYHGTRDNRQYVERLEILDRHDFDPKQDVRIDEAGLLSWNSDKPGLHREILEYFQNRQEDS